MLGYYSIIEHKCDLRNITRCFYLPRSDSYKANMHANITARRAALPFTRMFMYSNDQDTMITASKRKQSIDMYSYSRDCFVEDYTGEGPYDF